MPTPAAPTRPARSTFPTLAALFGLLLSGLVACAGNAPIAACGVAGRQRSCMCNPSRTGVQACQLDGTWEHCTCLPASSNGGQSAGTSATAGTTSAGRGGSGGARAGSGAAGHAGRAF